MRQGNIFQFIGWLLTILAVAMFIPALSAFGQDNSQLGIAFSVSALLTAFVGVGLIATYRGSAPVATLNEGLVLVVLSWIIVPIFAAFPLALADGFPTLLDAWFEAVSGLTTTGATLITDYETTPKAIFVWRALLQWLGGLYVLLVAMHILVVIGATLLPVKRVRLPSPLIKEKTEDLTNRIMTSVGTLTVIYLVMTAGAFIPMWANGVPGWEAFCLALSTVSTGGFVTRAGSFDSYNAPIAEFILVIVMLLASMNIPVHWHGLRLRFQEYRNVAELRFLAIIVVLNIAVIWAVLAIVNGGAGPWNAIFNGVSLISTTGFYVDEGGSIADLPPILILVPLMIGGAALSTTGGFKVARFVLLIKHSSREMKRLSHPHGVFPIKFGDFRISEMTMDAVWALFLGFMSVTAVLAFVVGWAGFDFEVALFAAISAVMNGGPFLQAATGGEIAYIDFPPYVRALLGLGMIVGRVEVLAFLVIVNVHFWRR